MIWLILWSHIVGCYLHVESCWSRSHHASLWSENLPLTFFFDCLKNVSSSLLSLLMSVEQWQACFLLWKFAVFIIKKGTTSFFLMYIYILAVVNHKLKKKQWANCEKCIETFSIMVILGRKSLHFIIFFPDDLLQNICQTNFSLKMHVILYQYDCLCSISLIFACNCCICSTAPYSH